MEQAKVESIVSREIERFAAALKGDRKADETVRHYARAVEKMIRAIGEEPTAWTKADMESYRQALGRELGENTEYVHIAACNQYVLRMLDRPDLRMKNVKAVIRHEAVLTHAEVDRMLDAAGTIKMTGVRDRAIIACLYYTGLRCNEVANLAKSGVDFVRRALIVLGKGKNYDPLPVDDALAADLRAYLDVRPDGKPGSEDAMFLTRTGEAIGKSLVHKVVVHAAIEAGIKKHIHPHSLRHAICTHMIEAGVPVEQVQRFMRHDSIVTTMRYVGENAPAMRAAYHDAMARIRGAEPAPALQPAPARKTPMPPLYAAPSQAPTSRDDVIRAILERRLTVDEGERVMGMLGEAPIDGPRPKAAGRGPSIYG